MPDRGPADPGGDGTCPIGPGTLFRVVYAQNPPQRRNRRGNSIRVRRLVAIFVAPVLVALLVMGGCGPLGTRRSTDPSITADELQTRAVLGTIDEGATTDALERSRDAIDLSVALGNRDEAVGAAQMHLRAARAGLATTRIEHGEGPELRRAARALERGCRLAIDVGRWAGVPWLVAEASLSSPHPRRHRSDLRWAMRRGAYLDQRFDLEQARSMVQRDPLARFRLEEAAHEDDVAREDDGETAGLDLDRLGPAGLDARIARLGEATEHETEVAAMRDMARALGELDPTEPGAALVSALLAEADAGRISPDPQLLSDVAGPSRAEAGDLSRGCVCVAARILAVEAWLWPRSGSGCSRVWWETRRRPFMRSASRRTTTVPSWSTCSVRWSVSRPATWMLRRAI